MAIDVYAFRHGETEWNRMRRMQGQQNPPLNDNGTQQARALRDLLRQQGVLLTHARSSDLDRAVQTAEIVLDPEYEPRYAGVSMVHDPALRERGMGKLEGKYIREGEDGYVLNLTQDDIPGAESLDQMMARVKTVIPVLCSYDDGSRVGLFSHGGVVVRLHALLAGLPLDPTQSVSNGTYHHFRINRIGRLLETHLHCSTER